MHFVCLVYIAEYGIGSSFAAYLANSARCHTSVFCLAQNDYSFCAQVVHYSLCYLMSKSFLKLKPSGKYFDSTGEF